MYQQLSPEEENKAIVKEYRKLLRTAKPFLKDGDAKIIKKAFNVAVEAHRDVRRKSGEPYIFHPIAVAQIAVEEVGLGTTAIVCALMHDVVEDSDIKLDYIEEHFGPKVATIIDGLTKISSSTTLSGDTSQQAENFRKMILTLSDDVRVVLVKICDRLHNMRTMDSMPRHKQLKIASETIYLYAPLAHRLGLYTIKSELEDLYLKYTETDTYYEIAKKINETKRSRNKFIRDFINPIQQQLIESGHEFVIKGRPKSIYSIWNKMKKQNIEFNQVYDLFAIRIVLKIPIEKEKSGCWNVYSIVTDYYKPNPDRLRDWISTPKANGYESLHTTVMSDAGRWVEVQIRTQRMDDIAEKGYAAHWKYKGKKESHEYGLDQWITKVRSQLEQSNSSTLEFVDEFRSNLFNEEIFVFTPKGDLKVYPQGATVLDFAFDIHSDVGMNCIGAKIGHKLVPIDYILKNGNQLSVLTSKKQKPTEDWLKTVKTSKAKKRIKEFLREIRKPLINEGREILERKLKQPLGSGDQKVVSKLADYFHLNSITDFYYKLGSKEIDPTTIKKAVQCINDDEKKGISHPENLTFSKTEAKQAEKHAKEINKDKLVIGDDEESFDYRLAPCCKPIPGEEVFGFVTVHQGITIHKTNCSNATKLMSNYGYRIVKATWKSSEKSETTALLKISGTDRPGLLNDITSTIYKELGINIISINANTDHGLVEDIIKLSIKDKKQLTTLITNLKQIPDIVEVVRT
ncbi:MAG: bifunctional (p)ppGpp synthetase/guanosine-3',5'-bis(diphosphate) 3'-pyrophosphohydrolase [Cyclobacteriaceae bacterium]